MKCTKQRTCMAQRTGRTQEPVRCTFDYIVSVPRRVCPGFYGIARSPAIILDGNVVLTSRDIMILLDGGATKRGGTPLPLRSTFPETVATLQRPWQFQSAFCDSLSCLCNVF